MLDGRRLRQRRKKRARFEPPKLQTEGLLSNHRCRLATARCAIAISGRPPSAYAIRVSACPQKAGAQVESAVAAAAKASAAFSYQKERR